MILFREAVPLKKYLDHFKENNQPVNFVPTMGALHQGHISLIHTAKEHQGLTLSSIFVNPTQFNDVNDFQKYPVTISNDIALLEEAGCDILFLPSVNEMYPDGMQLDFRYDLGNLETVFEGKYRPGHFQGVCQVIQRLLHIAEPAVLFLGQKDYQQFLVIKKLADSLYLPVKVTAGPTIRELNGLAMSSRNMRLNHDEREKAGAIYQVLRNIKNNFTNTPFDKLLTYSENFLLHAGFSKVDYISIANAQTLEPVTEWNGVVPLVALTAAVMNDVRLIDNMLLT